MTHRYNWMGNCACARWRVMDWCPLQGKFSCLVLSKLGITSWSSANDCKWHWPIWSLDDLGHCCGWEFRSSCDDWCHSSENLSNKSWLLLPGGHVLVVDRAFNMLTTLNKHPRQHRKWFLFWNNISVLQWAQDVNPVENLCWNVTDAQDLL